MASTIKRSVYCWALNEAWERTIGFKVGFGRVWRVWRVGSGIDESMDEFGRVWRVESGVDESMDEWRVRSRSVP